MNLESARKLLLSLPHTVETAQWGDHLLIWAGEKELGGKMCAILSLGGAPSSSDQPFSTISYPTTPDRFAELSEVEGITPAKYLARLKWVSAARWSVFRNSEWEDELRSAHAVTLAKLSPRTRRVLALPHVEQRRILAERKALLAAKAKQLR